MAYAVATLLPNTSLKTSIYAKETNKQKTIIKLFNRYIIQFNVELQSKAK